MKKLRPLDIIGLAAAAGMLIAAAVASYQTRQLTPEIIQHAREQWAVSAVSDYMKGANVRPVVGEVGK